MPLAPASRPPVAGTATVLPWDAAVSARSTLWLSREPEPRLGRGGCTRG
jgi:hypothetical protein